MDLAAKIARQVIGWALIGLFGPAPLAALSAVSGNVECHMACCKRNHAQHSCDRHNGSDSASIGGLDDCRPDCSRAAAALGSTLAVLFPPPVPSHFAWTARARVSGRSNHPVVSSVEPTLYQRPPPVLSA